MNCSNVIVSGGMPGLYDSPAPRRSHQTTVKSFSRPVGYRSVRKYSGIPPWRNSVSIHGVLCRRWLGDREGREPGVAFEGQGDGVEGGQAVGEGGIKIAADPAPALQGGVGLPVAGDRLVPFGGLGSLLGDVVRPVHA